MVAKYIIRLDDACPTMQREKWDRFDVILSELNIKPIVSVIPNNKDTTLMLGTYDIDFWGTVRIWQNKGWDIALHGYEHLYATEDSGLVPINARSEFSGLPYEMQKEKIEKGIAIFNKQGINCYFWVAPSHSFDENTILALKESTTINTISDGIAFSMFTEYGMKWIPQQLWRPRKMPFGVWTICLHPETITDKEFNELVVFMKKNKNNFISASSIPRTDRKKNIVESLFEKLYWLILRIK